MHDSIQDDLEFTTPYQSRSYVSKKATTLERKDNIGPEPEYQLASGRYMNWEQEAVRIAPCSELGTRSLECFRAFLADSREKIRSYMHSLQLARADGSMTT